MSTTIQQTFEEYQKARIAFVQSVAELASRPQNIEKLYAAGVMPLLGPLLLDTVPSIQQSAALAIGRLANYSEEMAESVFDNDIVSNLISSLGKPSRLYKKAACYVFKSVAKHSPELAQNLCESGVLEPLVQCLEEFDPSTKEAAAWALGYIARHNEKLAQQVIDANAVDNLVMCLQEPEILLKRAASLTLCYLAMHNESGASAVAESGLDSIVFLLDFSDIQVKRNICQLLGNITKHSQELSTQVLAKLTQPKKLLDNLKPDADDVIKKNAAFCICEIVNKCPENAQVLASAGAASVLTEYIGNTKGDTRLYGILSLGFIAAFKEELATKVIEAKAINKLKNIIKEESHHHLKAAACYALGHIGRHSAVHAKEVADSDVLSMILYCYMDPNSTDDLKNKAFNALKKIIGACESLTSLEPLLHVAPQEVIEHILARYAALLKDNPNEMMAFAQDGCLQKIQELKSKDAISVQSKNYINEINGFFPKEMVDYYDPKYAEELLNKIG
ncbi:MAG: hypothetical protein MJ252_15260 [archaeon]|nr:hypothetical protein [archaeon]